MRENRALFNLKRAPEGLTFGQLRAASVSKRTLDALFTNGHVRCVAREGRATWLITEGGSDELWFRIAQARAATIGADA